MQHFCEMKDLGKTVLRMSSGRMISMKDTCPKEAEALFKRKARSTSKAVGHERSLDATKAVRHELGGQQKNCKCCEAEGTDKHRLHHCDELREKRNNMPDVVRSCEMKARSSKEDWKWQRALMSYLQLGKLGGQQTSEAEVDIGHFAVMGQRR